MKIDLTKVHPNPQQPRKRFIQTELDSLAETMAEVGLVQPIVVEQVSDENFILVDGERRLRAARQLGWNVIEAVVRPPSNHNGAERLICAVVANEQRADMNPMERARAYQGMLKDLGNVGEVGRMVGKTNPLIYSYLALLEFEPSVQRIFEHNALPVTSKVVTALRNLDRPTRERLATSAAVHGLSERVFLKVAQKYAERAIKPAKPKPEPEEIPVRQGEHFSALNLVRRMIPEGLIEPVRSTCRACDLYDMASSVTCRQCPLVDFLRRV